MPSGFSLAAFFHMGVKYVQELHQQKEKKYRAIKSKVGGFFVYGHFHHKHQWY